MTRSSFIIKKTPSMRFHDWLSLASARILRRIGPEKVILRASAYGLGEQGIMVGETFTSPLNFRRYVCTKIDWDDDAVPFGSATVYGREVK